MVMPRNAFLIDSSFIVERAHKTFLGTPLLMHEDKGRDFHFRLYPRLSAATQTLGIREGALGYRQGGTVAHRAQNVADLVTFLREGRIPFLYDPLARTSDMIGALRPGFSHIVTADAAAASISPAWFRRGARC